MARRPGRTVRLLSAALMLTPGVVLAGAAHASAPSVSISLPACPAPGVRVATISGGNLRAQLRAGTVLRLPQSSLRGATNGFVSVPSADFASLAHAAHVRLGGVYVVAVTCARAATTSTAPTMTAVRVSAKTISPLRAGHGASVALPATITEKLSATIDLPFTVREQGRLASGIAWVYLDNGALPLDAAPVRITDGRAIVTGQVLPGRHSLRAIVIGHDLGPSEVSAPLLVTGPKWKPTRIGLAADTGAGPRPWAVRMTAAVTSLDGAGVRAGQIAFYHQGTYLGAAPVRNGQAHWTWLTALAPVRAYTAVVSARYIPPAGSVQLPAVAAIPVRVSAAGRVNLKLQALTGTAGLALTTPFSDSNPVILPSPTLVSSGQYLESDFSLDPAAGTGITVTDARSTDLPWTVSMGCSALTDGAGDVINPENLGFISVAPSYLPDNALQAGSVTTTDIPPALAVPASDSGSQGLGGGVLHPFAAATHGQGTVQIGGELQLIVPTSAPEGDYAGTLTVTVS